MGAIVIAPLYGARYSALWSLIGHIGSQLSHGNLVKYHGNVLEKFWKFIGKKVWEPCTLAL